MIISRTGERQWINRHETFEQEIDDLIDLGNNDSGNVLNDYNDSTRGIQYLIQEAIDDGQRLRAVGGEWSWTKIAATNGVLLNTKPLNLTFRISGSSVSPLYAKTTDDLYFSQCGTSVQELSMALKRWGRSLRTSGASNGQTIVGAMSTGTHGAAIDLGSITECVVGLHIIVSPTRHIWLERSSYPVVSDSFVAKLDAERINDDELFNAALVSFGSFGFIHGVMIETEPLFLYECHRVQLPFNDALLPMMQHLDFTNSPLPHGSERPWHFQIVLNPYNLSGGVLVTCMYKRPYRADYTPPPGLRGGVVPGDDVPTFIGGLVGIATGLIPATVNTLVGATYKPYADVWGTHAEIFSNTDTHGKVLSSAVGINPLDVDRVTQILLSMNVSEQFSGIFSYRWVKGTQATLGFTQFDRTCIVELDGEYSKRSVDFCRDFWNELGKAGIPYTFHWGKVLELNETSIRSMYGADKVSSWLRARKTLMQDPKSMLAFTNDLMVDWGLDATTDSDVIV
ncbi:MAG TPA: FAD-binding protein [Candidatus Didemnitutus sp.]|nr:FAD-binding protein [Candidatus Didemnitutus sp.]